jgi:formiminotetrahydrofolate cyclodeaminase
MTNTKERKNDEHQKMKKWRTRKNVTNEKRNRWLIVCDDEKEIFNAIADILKITEKNENRRWRTEKIAESWN